MAAIASGFDIGADLLDLRRDAEAVQHDVGALRGERPGDAQADTAGRAGDDRGAPGECWAHRGSGIGRRDDSGRGGGGRDGGGCVHGTLLID
jgi:hypothetical protein